MVIFAHRSPASGRVLLLGAVHEAVAALHALLDSSADVVGLVTYDHDLAARTSGFVDLGGIAARHGVPMLSVADANSPEAVAWIRRLRPDLLVCVGWTRLLGPELLDVPRHGTVGFHASMLPHNRGRAPVNWAMIRGEESVGNTMMFLAPGIDTGDIVDQRAVPIEHEDTCGTVYAKVAELGADMLRTHLADLLRGTAPRTPQRSETHEPLLPKRTPEMGITSFDRTSVDVYNWIRALTRPYPGAFAQLGGRRVQLWRCDMDDGHPAVAPPGTILGADGTGVLVATRTGAVRLIEVQAWGAPAEPAASWLTRMRRCVGERFEQVDEPTLRWVLGLGPRPAATPWPGQSGQVVEPSREGVSR